LGGLDREIEPSDVQGTIFVERYPKTQYSSPKGKEFLAIITHPERGNCAIWACYEEQSTKGSIPAASTSIKAHIHKIGFSSINGKVVLTTKSLYS